jgi:hypothetical protein
MAEYGEWIRKGATISDVTAEKEYGVDRDFIVRGIRAGRLEYREGEVWGNPFLRLLRSQLEQYIAEERGADYLSNSKKATELRMIKKEIAQLKKKLKELESRKTDLENQT